MSNRINTYKDLLEEKQQLEALLKAQKELITKDLQSIKEELQPAAVALTFLGRLTTRNKGNVLLSEGASRLVDIVFRKLILAKAGWVTKLTVPFLLKNYSSHFISENKDNWLQKLSSWIKKKNGKTRPEKPDVEPTKPAAAQ